jgi:hypothetical protein
MTSPDVNSTKIPKTQADFYARAWDTLFNKLPKDEQEYIAANLNKPLKVVRSAPQPDSTISKFVKNVATLGEEMFEKASKAPKSTM